MSINDIGIDAYTSPIDPSPLFLTPLQVKYHSIALCFGLVLILEITNALSQHSIFVADGCEINPEDASTLEYESSAKTCNNP